MSNILLWIAVALPLTSLPTKDEPGKIAARYGIGQAINLGSTYSLKAIVHRVRPDGSDADSFYSGHTSASFTASGTLCSVDFDAWCVSSLLLSSSVGIFRVVEDRHYPSDVLVGVALGFTTGFLSWRF